MEEFIHKSCGQSCQVLFAEPSRTWAKDGNRQIVDDDLIIYRQDMTIPYKSLKSIIEGSLEVKLPTIWTVEKQR
jgi:hypothetical protein